MRTRLNLVRWLTVLLALGPAALAATSAAAGEEPAYWSLGFENDTPKQLVLEDSAGKLRFFWYVVYRVKNPESKPLPARLRLSMRLSIEKQVNDYEDGFDRVAEDHIEKKILERPVCNWAELRAEPLKPGETREGVAIFSIGNTMPDFDKLTVFVRGLAELRPLGRADKVRKYRERVLLLRYEQVPSRWRAGRELKYLPEEWTLDEVTVPDREGSTPEEADKLRKRLDEIMEKARKEEERRKKILEEPPPPPAKSSEGPAQMPVTAGPPTGQAAPDLVKSLRKLAAAIPTIRASFTERLGTESRRQEATGTITIGKDGRFAIERNTQPGTDRALKEQRVFDGQHLWIQTLATGVGESVRRWTVASTKKEWHSLEGKPEVDFASVTNPARAWRLFADDLLYMGTERLGRETAYVFEVQPNRKYEAILGGPLMGELFAKAQGHRIRFWLGSQTGFQLKMQVCDERGQAVAALECSELAIDAPVPADVFAYKPPAGAEVIDMNAAMAGPAEPKPKPSTP